MSALTRLDDRVVPRWAAGLRALLDGRALDRLDDRVVRGPLAPVRRRPVVVLALAAAVLAGSTGLAVARADGGAAPAPVGGAR